MQSFQVERSDRRYELFLDPSFLVREASRRALPKKPVLAREEDHGTTGLVFQDKREAALAGALLNVAAYSPSRALRHVAAVDLTKTLASPHENSLAFESTVQNKFVQSWLLSLYSKRAIARERDQSADQYTRSLYRFENALRLLYGQSVSFDVEIEPSFQPRLKAFGHSLDFSQLPDGVRSTVGWIADFMMRQDLVQWNQALGGKRPGVLLLDEVDAHLHPLWQRKLLPAMREALPDVQILVTSHSPFVISSCPNSRVHVLELDPTGRASVRPPVDSPIGESVTTTLKEIFGVDSRFDVKTERELDEWNTLKRREVGGSMSAADRSRLGELTITLAGRSEELKSIVGSPLTIPESVLHSLTADEIKPHPIKRRKRA
ncbi:MAG: AAA family ATPase [Bryobacteraceae bacterium]